MERFFKILYYYCLGILVVFIAYLSIMLSISPKKDALKRGFIPCTEEFVQNMVLCEKGQLICPLGYLWKDTKCNVSVILDGLGAWVRRKQNTPWESYLFEPIIEAEQDIENPYEGNVMVDMDNLNVQRQFIEARQKELEDAKSRQLGLDENVLRNDDNAKENSDENDYMLINNNQNVVNEGDISEEFFADKLDNDSEISANEKKVEEDNINKVNNIVDINNTELNKLKKVTIEEEK